MSHNSLSRRTFVQGAAGVIAAGAASRASSSEARANAIRLGGTVFGSFDSPDAWAAEVKRLGYGAAYCPVGADAPDDTVRAYEKAASDAGIVIAETGAWSNPIGPDPEQSRAAVQKCKAQLDLADRIGSKCCVNISGSVGEVWDGHHPDNLTDETFDKIVQVTREIIDEVEPLRADFTLETMPWAFPDSAESYLRLIEAVDRERFAAHFDPVNIVNSPRRYYSTGALIREFVEKLGPHIRSCHAKDIILQQKLTVHLDEIRPGLGGLDYKTYLREIAKLGDIPIMLEHLPNAEEYRLAAEHVRSVGRGLGMDFI